MDFINLQRLSSIRVSSIIWNHPEIKRQITELFNGHPRKVLKVRDLLQEQILPLHMPTFFLDQGRNKHFQSIINSALQYLDSTELTINAKNYCKDVVTEMGEKIYDWIYFVTDILRFNLKFALKIAWTCYGTIDENEIFTLWEKDQAFLDEKNEFFIAPASYIFACINAREDFVRNYHNEMEKTLQMFDQSFKLNEFRDQEYTLIASFLFYHITRFERDDVTYAENKTHLAFSPNTMFQLCASVCFPRAVSYFWNYLKEFGEDPDEWLLKTTFNCLGESHHFMRSSFKRGKSAELIFFLINQMEINQRSEFIKMNILKIFRRFLPVWPFHEIILTLIDEYFTGLSVDEYQNIFIFTQSLIKENEGRQTEKFYTVFEKILLSLTNNLRNEIFNKNFLSENLSIFDVKCLILIFSNIDESDFRSEAIQKIRPRFLLLAKEGNIKLINEFMKKILKSVEEQNEYKDYILSSLDQILNDLTFESADKLLDYFSKSVGERIPEERILLKNRINSLSVCEHLILTECRYDKAEKFLEWMIDNEEERESFRNSLDENWFICERTCEFWDKIIEEMRKSEEDIPSDCFKFFFEFPEEIESLEKKKDFYNIRQKFGKNFIEKFDTKGVQYKYDPNSRVMINRSWCLRLEEMDNLKYEKSELPNLFMKWICKDEKRRKDINENYFDDGDRNMFVDIVLSLLNFAKKETALRTLAMFQNNGNN